MVATATKIAFFYGRVSTEQQAGANHASLETQEARARSYCESHGYVFAHTFIDVQSGRRDDRTQYRLMVDRALAGEADVIVVQFLDRFGRNPREILRRYWDLEEHRVAVVTTDEDVSEELMLLMRAGLAGAESRRTSERVRSYRTSRAAKGVHFGRAPYGYRRTKINDEVLWEQEPAEAEIVRETFRLSTEENLGHKSVGDQLTAQGHVSRTGGPFAAYTVQHILTNPAIAGTLEYGRRPKAGNPQTEVVRVEGFFPAILSGAEWATLQERLQIRRVMPSGPTHKSEYLLSGIARCGHCGGPMIGKMTSTYKGKRYAKYYCSRAQNSRARCAFYNGHTAAKLDEAVLAYLGQYSDPKKVRELLDASEKRDIKRGETELRQVERRLTEVEADFTKNLDLLKREVLNEEEFNKANVARRDERARLTGRQTELTAWVAQQHDRQEVVSALPSRVRSFLKDFQSLDVRRAKALLQTILAAATVSKDGTIELTFR
jgi:DNA invertase Pin-like site-specific DNA recombinase